MDIDTRIERERRKQEIYEMSKGVRIASGHEAEGAVAELIEAAHEIEWIWSGHVGSYCQECHNEQRGGHKNDCKLAAALARFEVDTEGES